MSRQSIAKMSALVTDGSRSVAPMHLNGVVMEHMNVYTATTPGATLPGSCIPNGLLFINFPTGGELYLPTYVDIVAAFVAAGTTLTVGDMFKVYFQNISTTTTIELLPNTGVESWSAIGVIDVANNSRSNGFLLFHYVEEEVGVFKFRLYVMMGR